MLARSCAIAYEIVAFLGGPNDTVVLGGIYFGRSVVAHEEQTRRRLIGLGHGHQQPLLIHDFERAKVDFTPDTYFQVACPGCDECKANPLLRYDPQWPK